MEEIWGRGVCEEWGEERDNCWSDKKGFGLTRDTHDCVYFIDKLLLMLLFSMRLNSFWYEIVYIGVFCLDFLLGINVHNFHIQDNYFMHVLCS